ncbi:hypothetical protein AAC387_Pa03g4193 [Persea americana]
MAMMNDKQCQTSNQKQPKKPQDQTSQSPPNQPTEFAPLTTHFLPYSTDFFRISPANKKPRRTHVSNRMDKSSRGDFLSISALLGVSGILGFRENRG